MFPEGNIERPPGQILPFREGVGMLIARTGPEVIPILIEGTPQGSSAWASLWTRSRTRLRILEPVLFERSARKRDQNGATPDDITIKLRQVFLDESGWPSNPDAPRYEDGQWWYADGEGGWVAASESASTGGSKSERSAR